MTGAHNLKLGVQYGEVTVLDEAVRNQHIIQQYRNGAPASVLVDNTPQDSALRLNPDLGLYVQDTWTIDRLTLNPGLRFEHFAGYIPAQDAPAGRFVPARHFDKIPNLPNWTDWTPRFSAAYDLFANGQTALKASVSKYLVGESVSFTGNYNPMQGETDQRTWRDPNGDDIAQDDEIGPPNDLLFGTGQTRRPDPDIKRPFNMEYTVGVQHALLPRVSVGAGYYKRRYHNMITSDNLLVGPEDYSAVMITSPLNGEQIPVYNLSRAKQGAVDTIDRNSDINTRKYQGIEFTLNARLGRGTVFGGMTTGKLAEVNCDVDDPNRLRFCDQTPTKPYLTQFKLAWAYPLPYGVNFAGTLQSYPDAGVDNQGNNHLTINYNVNRTLIPELTQTQVVVPLIAPGDKYLPRLTKVDFRVGKTIRIDRFQWQLNLDIFNALNSNALMQVFQTFGPALDRPDEILQGRLYRFTLNMNF